MKDQQNLTSRLDLELFIEELSAAENYEFMSMMHLSKEFIYSREAYEITVKRMCGLSGSGAVFDAFCLTFDQYVLDIPKEDPAVLRDMVQASFIIGDKNLIFEAQSGTLNITINFDSTGSADVWMVSIYLQLLAVQKIINFYHVTSLLMRTHNDNGTYQVGSRIN